jgi:golgin subfamily B member 1
VASGRLDLAKQVDVRCRLGRLYRKLGDHERSIATYTRVLDLSGDNQEALQALDTLLEHAGRFAELLPVLRHQRRLVEDGAAVLALDYRIAQLLQKRLGDLPGALELYHQILERDSNHAPTLAAMAEVLSDGDQALALWKRLVELRGDDPVALGALATLYERREMRPELLDVLERQTRLATVSAERLELLRRRAKVARDLGAFPQLGTALETIVGELSGLVSRDELVLFVTELAELETNTLQRSGPAIEAWRRALALDPTQLQALTALEILFAREERWRECIQVLEKQATIAGLDNRRRELELLLQVASIWEVQIRDRAQARLAYERVRAADPSDPIASAQLETMYRDERDWPKVVQVLEERARAMDNASNRIAVLIEVARIYEDELGDPSSVVRVIRPILELEADLVAEAADLWLKIGQRSEAATAQISAFRAALLADPNCAEAAAALERLYRAQNMSEELLGLLNGMAATTSDPGDQVRLLLEIGQLTWQRREPDPAIEAYRNALLIEPESLVALRALEQIYESLGHTDELAEVLGRELEASTDMRERQRIEARLAQILGPDPSSDVATLGLLADLDK